MPENNLYNQESEDIDEEEQYAAELETYQTISDIDRTMQAIKTEGESYDHPSRFKYGLLLLIAVVADALIIFSYLILGLGIIASTFIALPFISSIILISWFTDAKVKRAKEHHKEVEQAIATIQQRIAYASSIALTAAKYGRKVPLPVVKLAAKGVVRAMSKVRKVAGKSPMTRILVTSGANSVSFLNIVPWQTLGVILAYRAESKTYESARQTSREAIGNLTGLGEEAAEQA
ncbi:MAG: hypothetical protein A3J47_03335 [Candidatus Yanofskybacteria bacterium RIFCSPHIGHO2_02_FULL_43_22]|uniref:Uncharacterized protein n=1 Tax=Candidatus Yanofskybacteria bacterium RIFCSPHIGHO2_02_FULL_43_22 TaxID=1802681 RepID=A0A1F8FSW0_9BACT|nr:MAG: hypothetical protein A3J47_03335 [Candidatus Yanofskybacteria bacterium RIFCSPHIGHO2_02_FULL_43_22]